MRLALIALVLGGCGFPSRSSELSCQITADCDGDRVCSSGFCIVGSERPDGGDLSEDSAADATLPPDADAFEAIAAMCTTAGYTPATNVTGALFRDVNQATPWLQAQADCKDDVAGATHLIVLSSEAEVTFMKTTLGWVGLFDNDTNVYQSVTGEPDDLRPFLNGQPDDGNGNENCLQMKAAGLDDDQCGNNHRYVCECDGKASTP